MSGTGWPVSLSVTLSPERVRMRPSGSVVTVGYQRARVMSAARNQVRVVGLKMLVSFVPS